MITKNLLIVIFIFVAALTFASCDLVNIGTGPERSKDNVSPYFGEPKEIGKLRLPRLTESSGLAITACHPETIWTINDSGNSNEIFAFTMNGRSLSTWNLTGATNVDWEAMGSYRDEKGDCYLYVADIGNNEKKRNTLTVYSVQEPDPKGRTGKTSKVVTRTFSYPQGTYDAEAFLVHPKTKDLYVITKESAGGAKVFRLTEKIAVQVGTIELPSLPIGAVTGADINEAGNRVILSDYFGAYELVLPDDATSFEAIWKQKPMFVDAGVRQQGEAIAYTRRVSGFIVTSEKANSPIIYVERNK